MTVVRCGCENCINRGKECCTEKRIVIDIEGFCENYCSYDDFMRRKPKNDKKY